MRIKLFIIIAFLLVTDGILAQPSGQLLWISTNGVDSTCNANTSFCREQERLVIAVTESDGSNRISEWDMLSGNMLSEVAMVEPIVGVAPGGNYFYLSYDSLLMAPVIKLSSDSTTLLTFPSVITLPESISFLYFFGSLEQGCLVAISVVDGVVCEWMFYEGTPLSNSAMVYVLPTTVDSTKPYSYSVLSDSLLYCASANTLPILVKLERNGTLSVSNGSDATPNVLQSAMVEFALKGERYLFAISSEGMGVLYGRVPNGTTWQEITTLTASLNGLDCSDSDVPMLYVTTVAHEVYVFVVYAWQQVVAFRFYDSTVPNYPQQNVLRYTVGFEQDEGFESSSGYLSSGIHTEGVSGSDWEVNRASVVSFQTIRGARSLMMRMPNSLVNDPPYAIQNFDVDSVVALSFMAFGSPEGKVKLVLSCSTNGGMSYPYQQTYFLSTVQKHYSFMLPVVTDSVRVRFEMLSVDSGSGIRVAAIDSICFLGRQPIKKLPIPKVINSPLKAQYVPLKLALAHDIPNSTLIYTTNGTFPTLFNGEVYSDSIELKRTTTLRCLAYQTGYEMSDVLSQTIYFGAIDTLYSMYSVADIVHDGTDYYYHFLCELPITYHSGMLTYFYDGSIAFRFLGTMNAHYVNGDIITSCIVKANYTRNETYFEPLWIESHYGGEAIAPEEVLLGTINEQWMNRYVKVESVALSNSVLFNGLNVQHDTVYVLDASGVSLPLKNVLLAMDGHYSNFFRYDLTAVVSHYGGELHLYPVALTPRFDTGLNLLQGCILTWQQDVLSIENIGSEIKEVKVFTVDGREIQHLRVTSMSLKIYGLPRDQYLLVQIGKRMYKVLNN